MKQRIRMSLMKVSGDMFGGKRKLAFVPTGANLLHCRPARQAELFIDEDKYSGVVEKLMTVIITLDGVIALDVMDDVGLYEPRKGEIGAYWITGYRIERVKIPYSIGAWE